MHRILAVVVVSVMVVACTHHDSKKEDVTLLQGRPLTTSLAGKPLSETIAKLGLPAEERTVTGQTVYIWQSSAVVEGTERKCQIRAIMNGNVVGSFNYEGDNLVCMRYLGVLK
jgi:hypothetical protein